MTLADRTLREQTLFHLYINPPYDETERALRLALDKAVNKIYTTKGAWTRAKMASISKAIADNINQPYAGLLKRVQVDLGEQIKTTSLFKVDRALVEELVNPDNLVQGYSMADLFKTTQANHIKQLQVTFAAAAARGEPVNTIVKDLYDKNAALTKNQLKSAIVTTGNEARARLRHENYKALEDMGLIDGYVYDATLDGRTTEYCRNHDGKIYHKNISEIRNQINTHFRCRSVFRPYSKDVKTRASVFGPTENIPYGQWFAKQDNAFKETVLGKKKFSLYQAGTYRVGSVADLGEAGLGLNTIENSLGTVQLSPVETVTKQDWEILSTPSTEVAEVLDTADYFINGPIPGRFGALRKAGNAVGLTDDEVKALIMMTSDIKVDSVGKPFYQVLNAQLRGVGNVLRADQVNSYKKILNKTLDKLPRESFEVLYRGVDLTEADVKSFVAGSVHTFKSFTSTSTTLAGAFDKSWTLVIKPTSHRGGYLGSLSSYKHESEFLFKADTAFSVVDIDYVTGKIFMEELP